MDQIKFSDLEYQGAGQVELLIPWDKLEKKVRSHYPKAGRGSHPYL